MELLEGTAILNQSIESMVFGSDDINGRNRCLVQGAALTRAYETKDGIQFFDQ